MCDQGLIRRGNDIAALQATLIAERERAAGVEAELAVAQAKARR